jgi:hypothetical protein
MGNPTEDTKKEAQSELATAFAEFMADPSAEKINELERASFLYNAVQNGNPRQCSRDQWEKYRGTFKTFTRRVRAMTGLF